MIFLRIVVSPLGLLAFAAMAGALEPARPGPEALEFFEAKIRPVLVAECYECHGASKQKGGLRLDSREALKKGGDSGDAIVPGDAAGSLLLRSIRHEDPDLKMPDKSPKLEDSVIADFAKWVGMGAPDPRDAPPPVEDAGGGKPNWAALLAARKGWWALQPVEKVAPPVVRDAAWSAHPVDRFLLAAMEARGLSPAPPADPRALFRRVSFALTGLPPAPADLEAFVKAQAADPAAALAAAVERLLNAPAFGEHWARHWMDLMRYAETHGSESDPEIPQAWRYRDYLVRAFNGGLPLDALIREHLAGDLLPAPRLGADGLNESILGTAQLRMVEHGFQPVDSLDDQVKAVDNQIDVVSKAFQGLTVSCARCHDHKFDAISQRDYYALDGIFASSRPAQVAVDAPEVLEKNRVPLQALHGRLKEKLAAAWMEAAGNIGAQLLAEPGRVAQREKTAASVRALQEQIAALEWSARERLQQSSAPAPARKAAPVPMALWDFSIDARDAAGGLHGQLEGGAEIKNGRLLLNGTGAFVRTALLARPLREKTLEAWVAVAGLDQRGGGGVLSIESPKARTFDAIVYAEQEGRRWLAGSNNFVRTRSAGGPAEDAQPGRLVHLAIVYGADHSIALYRDGVPYGAAYAQGELSGFEPGDARVLLGLRHTGAGNGFFKGEIEEARLYDRALSAKEVAASFEAGTPPFVSAAQISEALSQSERTRRAALQAEIERLKPGLAAAADPLLAALQEAREKPGAGPLGIWTRLGGNDAPFEAAAAALEKSLRADLEKTRAFNRDTFNARWDLGNAADYKKWFRSGTGLPETARPAGGFSIETEGGRVLSALRPAGIQSNEISGKHGALLTSPAFVIDTDFISVRAFGADGAMVRVVIDNYPLPSAPIFPQAVLGNDAPDWIRLDTAYRKGSRAYLEFATRDELTRPLGERKAAAAAEGRSHFGVERVVFHDSKEMPRAENAAWLPLFEGGAPASLADLAGRFQSALKDAVTAWREERLSEPQRAFLDDFVRRGILPVTVGALESAGPEIAEYRALEAAIPVPRRAPGVVEAAGYNAPFLPRGDHLKPGEPVPRRFLEVVGSRPYSTALSGRFELAQEIASPANPLTARVMANRVWHWLFGRGLVATVDNFGRLGEKPSHPELLDFLAGRLVENGWSARELIAFLINSRAFQMSSEASAAALENDPANLWLSHMRVRRLEAEAIRDSILAVSGRLNPAMGGPGEGPEAPRRSLYLQVRRTGLNAFLQVFDAPRPFTTLGRREATNVPAQSLVLLNSPFVIEQARAWSQALVRGGGAAGIDGRVDAMFETALGRSASSNEKAASSAYLNDLAVEQNVSEGRLLENERVWQDFAQSLFNLKEFIYVR